MAKLFMARICEVALNLSKWPSDRIQKGVMGVCSTNSILRNTHVDT